MKVHPRFTKQFEKNLSCILTNRHLLISSESVSTPSFLLSMLNLHPLYIVFFIGVPEILVIRCAPAAETPSKLVPSHSWVTSPGPASLVDHFHDWFPSENSERHHTWRISEVFGPMAQRGTPNIEYTPPKFRNRWLEDYFAYWEGNFSGAMLNFGRVLDVLFQRFIDH